MKKQLVLIYFLVLLFLVSTVAAKVDIISYCDVTLESCKNQDQALLLLEEKYPLDLRVEFLYYFDTSDAQKTMAHVALECAAWQGHKADYKLEVQNNLDDLSRDALEAYAGIVGLSMSNFTLCLDTQMSAWAILDEILEADDDGVTSAPSLRMNMDMYTGSQTFTSLEALAQEYLGLNGDAVEAVTEDDETQVEEYVEPAPADQEEIPTLPNQDSPPIESVSEAPLFVRVVQQFWDWVIGLWN
jgi:hypothetical protein